MALENQFVEWLNDWNGSAFSAVKGVVTMLEESLQDVIRHDGVPERGRVSYVTREHSSICAVYMGEEFDASKSECCAVVLASHTDSPALRSRPCDNVQTEKTQQLGVSTYGGGLWYTWFDRPLGVSGLITYEETKGKVTCLESDIVRLHEPIAVLPSLCIHLQNSDEVAAFKPQKEDNLRPVLCTKPLVDSGEKNALQMIVAEAAGIPHECLLSYDLCLFPAEPASIIGYESDMINAPGLDNKSSLWTTFTAFIELVQSDRAALKNKLVVCVGFDHEEIGSESTVGARGDLLTSTVARAVGPAADLAAFWGRSLVLSADAAHAVHPNYPSKHQAQHKPYINEGVVIKINANQRYATSAGSIAMMRSLAKRSMAKTQEFIVRNDTPCGSTIGPMTAAKTGCRTVDIGMPIWAMHSARETCGTKDLSYMVGLCKVVVKEYGSTLLMD